MSQWYPNDKSELDAALELFLLDSPEIDERVHGIIVPHAGFDYSWKVAAKAYKAAVGAERAIVIGPSHYIHLNNIVCHSGKEWKTPIGSLKVEKLDEFEILNIKNEHSIDNQMPFLKKIGVKEVIPLMVGSISWGRAKEIAGILSKVNALYVFSTDLSHFLNYAEAKIKDRVSIKIIENLDDIKIENLEACGLYGLMILIELCKLSDWKPRLIEYQNSGEITGDKSKVVGYASFWF